jgi:hypothetical protein
LNGATERRPVHNPNTFALQRTAGDVTAAGGDAYIAGGDAYIAGGDA